MDMTKFLSDQDPDYQNVLSELRRFIEPGLHQSKNALRSTSSESSGTGERFHYESQNHSYSAEEHDQTAMHEQVNSRQPARSVSTFSGNFNTGGGKMILGGEFNSGGGSMSF